MFVSPSLPVHGATIATVANYIGDHQKVGVESVGNSPNNENEELIIYDDFVCGWRPLVIKQRNWNTKYTAMDNGRFSTPAKKQGNIRTKLLSMNCKNACKTL